MKQKIKLFTKSVWLLPLLVVLQACYPGGSIPIADLDTTSTFYNTDDLATAPNSAALIWNVAHLELGDNDDLPYDGEIDSEILNTTLEQLVDLYGPSKVVIIWMDSTTSPSPPPSVGNIDVFVPGSSDPQPMVESLYAPSILLRNKEIGIVYPPYGWGGGWWGGWYPGYPGGCYYCGYPPQVGYIEYEVGSVILDMFDLTQITPGGIPNNFDPSWLAVMRGLISNTGSFNKERTVTGIQQAFRQSPYLKN